MKEYTPIEKDTILRCFYLGVSVNYQSCQDIINILVADEYVVLRTSVNGRAYHITDKGKGFILQGGYAKQDKSLKAQKRFTLQMNAMGWIVTIIASIIGVIGGFILSKLTQ